MTRMMKTVRLEPELPSSLTALMKAPQWTIKGGRVLGPAPFLIAGIVNATPDSFFDGSESGGVEACVAKGKVLADAGAHILDVGGESTRPGAVPVYLQDELDRVLPVIEGLVGLGDKESENILGACPVVSVDTYKAGVAAAALDAGAAIVNDVSGCRFDPELMDVVADKKPGYVLMHTLNRPQEMQADPRYDDVVSEIMSFFSERLDALSRAGLPQQRIVLDPGIGFGKTAQHNVTILKNIDRFEEFGLPLYVGLSNKSVWGELLNLELDQRTNATVAATVMTFAKGVFVHRVHDVAAAHQALSVASQIL